MQNPQSNQQPSNSHIEEFHRLFLQNQPRVFAYVLTLLSNLHDAEEVAQDTSVILLSKVSQWTPGTDFSRWACQIAHFEVMNYRRRRHKERLRFSDQVIDSLAAKHVEWGGLFDARREALQNCIKKLSPSERELIVERYQKQRTARAAAESLGRPSNTAYKMLSRIRRNLLACIERTVRSQERAL